MKNQIIGSIVIIGLMLSGCSVLKVAKIEPTTGYFPGGKIANIIKNESINLDSMKSLILVTGGEFVKGQVENIGYFGQVIDRQDLEREIVKKGLQDLVPSIDGPIGINKAYTHYKPFLWLRYDTRGSGNQQYAQFILTDPATLNDIFVAEEHLDYVWKGVNDQMVWYPLSNAFVKYIREHSKSSKSNSF